MAANITPVGNGPFGVRPRLRGLDSTRLLVLVDGERLNTARQATDRTGAEVGLVSPDAISRMEVVNGAGTLMYGSDALAGTINIITNEADVLAHQLEWLYGFNGFYSSNENGGRGTGTVGVTVAAFRGARPGRARKTSTTTRPATSTSEDTRPLLRVRRARPGRHDRRQLRLHASTRSPIRSTRRTCAPTTRCSTRRRAGNFVNVAGLHQARRAPLGARALPAAPDGGRRLPGLRRPVLLQRHVAAAQQPRSRVGALRGAGGHAVAREPVADGLLPADRAPAAEPAAGAVPGADAARIFPDQRVPARHPVRDRAAGVDARRRRSGRASCRPRITCSRPASRSIATAAAIAAPRRPRPRWSDRWCSGRAVRRRWCFPIAGAARPAVDGATRSACPTRASATSRCSRRTSGGCGPNLSLVAGLRGDFYNVTTEATPGYDVDAVVAGAQPPIDPSTLPDPNGATYTRQSLTGDIGLVANQGGRSARSSASAAATAIRTSRRCSSRDRPRSAASRRTCTVKPETGQQLRRRRQVRGRPGVRRRLLLREPVPRLHRAGSRRRHRRPPDRWRRRPTTRTSASPASSSRPTRRSRSAAAC